MAAGATGPAGPGKTRIALCQFEGGKASKADNIAAMRAAVREAAEGGAQLALLPEMWHCPYSNDAFPGAAEDIDAGSSESVRAMAEAASASGITVVGGTISEARAGGVYNTCCVLGPDGALLGKYSKTHLFDIDIPGKVTFRESDTLTRGPGLTVVDTPIGRVGLGICYDLRFPELAMAYARRGCHLICYPGAFNTTTGPLHWSLLQRARAVDNQLFVASACCARDESASYVAYGHSMAVGPFGEVLVEAETAPGVFFADLDMGEIATRRSNMPLASQRRGDLYEFVDKTA
ncbi:unnamed protein product [Pedinophyceae sp. YPF-701]|nr:unnamed protein product [Pedinophyceae sp. YPF-701]